MSNLREIACDAQAVFNEARAYHSMTPRQQHVSRMMRRLDEIQAIDEGRMGVLAPGSAKEAMAAAEEGYRAAKGQSSGRKVFYFPNNPLAKSR